MISVSHGLLKSARHGWHFIRSECREYFRYDSEHPAAVSQSPRSSSTAELQMLVSCGNPDCHIQYASNLRACPVCSTPKPTQLPTADAKPEGRSRQNTIGIVYSFLAVSSLAGVVGAAMAGALIAIPLGLIMTFVWGRLAVTAFEEDSVK